MTQQATASFTTSGEQVHIVRRTERKTVEKLPPIGQRRWVMRRKAQVVEGVRTGIISLNEACERYHLSEEEFHSWAKLLDSHGMQGLRATRIQEYREGAND